MRVFAVLLALSTTALARLPYQMLDARSYTPASYDHHSTVSRPPQPPATPSSYPHHYRAKRSAATIDTFDDRTASSFVPVGTYHGCNYTGFHVAAATSAVKAASEPNVLSAASSNNAGTIAVGAGLTSFDVDSFNFACHAETSQACSIDVAGTYPDGTSTSTVSYDYSPDTSDAADMTVASLPATFSGVKSVSIKLNKDTNVTPETALVIDDFSHVDNA